MRRIASLTCALVCFALPASASAAITTTNDPAALAGALDAGTAVTGATFVERPATGTPHGIADAALGSFTPVGGTFAILTTGDAAFADDVGGTASLDLGVGPAHGYAGAPGNLYDTSELSVAVNVPPGANCMSIDFRFLSEDFNNDFFNDGFLAMRVEGGETSHPGGDLAAPTNFAFDETGSLASARGSLTTENAAGTVYDGATQILSARRSVTPGAQTLYLAVFDTGDAIVDSAVFLDNLQFLTVGAGGCEPAIDRTDPTLTLNAVPTGGTPTNGPVLTGQAGGQATDSANVTVQIYPTGATVPVRVLTAGRLAGDSWRAQASGLPPGDYFVHAHQTDAAGNLAVSVNRTFTIGGGVPTPTPTPSPTTTPTPPVEVNGSQSPQPVLGETVVAGKVGSGTVRVKLRNGKFRTLGANEAIPLGSTVDATKGRVRLTSAAGPGSAVQTADFYKGAFVVTQTGGAKPITQLKLSGTLTCAKKGKKASTSAKKKVRRLWGDGKGRFRTRGRHGAATVRGTKWLTEDRCDSTKISVKRGSVVVRDYAKKKNKVVKKGQSYVARAKKKK